MPPSFLYLLKLSAGLAIIWSFYRCLLRRLTFYDLNRWYLLGYSILCFFIPLVDVGPVLEKGGGREPLVMRFIPAVGNYRALPVVAARPAGFNSWNGLLIVIGIGTGFLLIRLALRWFSLRMISSGARLVEEGGMKIYYVKKAIAPFSFGNAIYINPGLHTGKEWREIILHEYVHIRQKHSVDILLAELLCVVNWYNPFAWFIRYSIRQNLEFIADREVLGSGVDKKGYQYHLLKVIGDSGYRLANNFNISSLKKRIIMMNKFRSARLHLVKFLFILPLTGVLLVAFRKAGLSKNTMEAAHGSIAAPPDSIAAVSVLKLEAAHRLYGEKAKNGAGMNTTKAFREKNPVDGGAGLMDSSEHPVYVLDGFESTDFHDLNPYSVLLDSVSVSVYKSGEAMDKFGEMGRRGVIVIQKKKKSGL